MEAFNGRHLLLVCPQVAFASCSDHTVSLLDVCRYIILWIECQLPWQAFDDMWVGERPVWVEEVHSAPDARSIAPLLLQLEGALKRDLLTRRWLSIPFEVCAIHVQ